MEYYRPNGNFKIGDDGDGHDVSFTIDCEGMTSEKGSRWTTMTPERRDRIVNALEFVGQMYASGASPNFEKTPTGTRLVFKETEIKYRSFRLRYKRALADWPDLFRIFADADKLTESPRSAFREIWEAFYGDVASHFVRDHFYKWHDFVCKQIEEEE